MTWTIIVIAWVAVALMVWYGDLPRIRRVVRLNKGESYAFDGWDKSSLLILYVLLWPMFLFFVIQERWRDG